MPTLTTLATLSEKSERAPRSASPRGVVGSPRTCPICGTPLKGRQEACSGKCRAAKSRQSRVPIPRKQLLEIRALVKNTLEELYRAKGALDRCLGGP